ncbi:histidinol-phosphate transaminase [Puniceicoccaceae bacterium K14]|nr:histidinol-phosphate transaminase [Puniceicoccaceae bacterium K14]
MALTYSDLVKKELLTQPIYQPGKPIDDVARDLGLDPATILKLASNENPLGPSPQAIEAGKQSMESVHLYPDGGCYKLKESLSQYFGLNPDQFIIGNGSNEVLEILGHAFVDKGDEVVMAEGAFIVYKLVTLLFGGTAIEVPMVDYRHDLKAMIDAINEKTKLVFIATPNNPSGTANEEEELHAFVNALPDHVVCVIDEAYAEYLDPAPNFLPLIEAGKKIFCTRTFSKIYGLAGLRIGYGYGDAELVGLLNRAREPFNSNTLAQETACAALLDDDWVTKCREANAAGLQQLESGFSELNLEFIKSFANFVTVRIGDGADAFQKLQNAGVIVRPLAPYGMPEWVRVSVGLSEENERALLEIKNYLSNG